MTDPLQALKELYNMIEAECQCVDPPHDLDYDEPENHSQYCPLFLLYYIVTIIDENEAETEAE
jgi:hypothetical protein